MEQPPQPTDNAELTPQTQAFFEALDYPESTAHQMRFDEIAEIARKRIPSHYRKVFSAGVEYVRWSFWPSAQLPETIENFDTWFGNHIELNQSLGFEGVYWAKNAMYDCGLNDLAEEIYATREGKYNELQVLVRSRIKESAVYKHLALMAEETQETQERPLSFFERTVAEQTIRQEVANTFHMQPDEVIPDHTAAGNSFRRKLAWLDNETIPESTASSSPGENFLNLLARSATAYRRKNPEHKDTACTVEQLGRIEQNGDETHELPDFMSMHSAASGLELTFGTSSDFRMSIADANTYLCAHAFSAIKEGQPLAEALAVGLEAASEEMTHKLLSNLGQVGGLEQRLYFANLKVDRNKKQRVFPRLTYPDFFEDPFDFDDLQPDSKRKWGPRALWNIRHKLTKPQPESEEMTPQTNHDIAVSFDLMNRDKFATFAKVGFATLATGRMLELIEPYQPSQQHGSPDIKLALKKPVSGVTPYIEGYELLDADLPAGQYHFAKTNARDAYQEIPVPIAEDRQAVLADFLYDTGLRGAAEQIEQTQDLTLHGIERVLAGYGRYIMRSKRLDTFSGQRPETAEEFAQFVQYGLINRNGQYLTQCTGAALLLDKAVEIALPDADRAFVTGRLLPFLGRKIARMAHVQLEVTHRGTVQRLDATPSRMSPTQTLMMGIGRFAPGKESALHAARAAAQQLEAVRERTYEVMASALGVQPCHVIEQLYSGGRIDGDPLCMAAELTASAEKPQPDAIDTVIAYLRSVAAADSTLLRQAGLGRYASLHTHLIRIAEHLEQLKN